MEYFNPDLFRIRWTSATSFDTEAVGVPIGIRQKSATATGGVDILDRSDDIMMGE
jgi:hypothetical protein